MLKQTLKVSLFVVGAFCNSAVLSSAPVKQMDRNLTLSLRSALWGPTPASVVMDRFPRFSEFTTEGALRMAPQMMRQVRGI